MEIIDRLGGTLVAHEPKSLTKTRSNKINPEISIKVESSPPSKRRKADLKVVASKHTELKIKAEPADTSYDLFDSALKTKNSSGKTKQISDISTKRRGLLTFIPYTRQASIVNGFQVSYLNFHCSFFSFKYWARIEVKWVCYIP